MDRYRRVVTAHIVLGAVDRTPSLALRIEADSLSVHMDDVVYEKHRDVWEAIPRGQARVYAHPGGELLHTSCGVRKFGYAESVCYGYASRARSVLAMEKENGENAQISAFMAGDTRVWLIGSKHVPMALRHDVFEADLEHPDYVASQRYGFARKIARLFYTTLLAPHAADGRGVALHDALCANRCTVVGEAIFMDSQHLVRYEADALRAFALTLPSQPSAEGLTALHPLAAFDFFKAHGVEHARIVGTAELHTPAYAQLCAAVQELRNSEGAVMYGMDSVDASAGAVCFMYKWKSHDYVIGRRARQVLMNAALPLSVLAAKLRDLVRVGVGAHRIEAQLSYYVRFGHWLRRHPLLTGAATTADRRAVQASWVTLHQEFGALSPAYDMEAAEAEASGAPPKCVIMLQGLPLSGKSTIARALFALLRRAGHVPVWINSDEMPGSRANRSAKRAAYVDAIRAAMASPTATHVLLDKSNLAEENVNDYFAAGAPPAVCVKFSHPDDAPGSFDRLLDLCKARFEARGEAHRTLTPSGTQEGIASILAMFTRMDAATSLTSGAARAGAGAAGAAGAAAPPPPLTSDAAFGSSALDDADADSHLGFVVHLSVLLPPRDALQYLWGVLAANGFVSEVFTPAAEHAPQFERALAISSAFEALLHSKPPRTRFWGLALEEDARAALFASLPAQLTRAMEEAAAARVAAFTAARALPTDAEPSSHTPAADAEDGEGEWCTPVTKASKRAAAVAAKAALSAAAATPGLRALTSVHHTLAYVGLATDPELEVEYAPRIGEAVRMRVTRVVWDDRVAAAVVEGTPSRNAFPHITLALAHEVQPVTANKMLAEWDAAKRSGDAAALARFQEFELPAPLELSGTLRRNPA